MLLQICDHPLVPLALICQEGRVSNVQCLPARSTPVNGKPCPPLHIYHTVVNNPISGGHLRTDFISLLHTTE